MAAPHSASMATRRRWLTALRSFFRWCEQRKLLRTEPTWGIRLKLPKSDGHHTWSEDEIAAFEAHHAVGSKARLKIGRQHIRDGVLAVRQQKTGASLAIP